MKWPVFKNPDVIMEFARFADTEAGEAYTVFKGKVGAAEATAMRSLGFVRAGDMYFRAGATISSAELKTIFGPLSTREVDVRAVHRLYAGRTPEYLRNHAGSAEPSKAVLEANEIDKADPLKGTLYKGQWKILNAYQVEYTPQSGAGTATAAIPIHLAEGTFEALERVRDKYGDIDIWLARELQYGSVEAMSRCLAPEQVDAVALSIYNIIEGTGAICGDMTGMGKGRIGAEIVRWCILNDIRVIFLTEKPNLFTDFWRDLRATETADLVGTPYILNDGATIVDQATDKVLFKSLKPAENKAVIASGELPPGTKVVFATYSQLARKDSAKSEFFKKIAVGSHLHSDESHNAAGEESNTNLAVMEAMEQANSFTYSSATHAPRPANLPVYKPLLPPSIANLENMVDILKAGGAPLMAAITRMLAQSGRIIRREHDLSAMKLNLRVDHSRQRRHEELSDHLAMFLRSFSDLGSAVMKWAEARNEESKKEFWTAPHWGGRTAIIPEAFETALLVDFAVDLGIERLKAGEKVVYTLVSTMESLMKELVDGAEDDEELIRSPDLATLLEVMVKRSMSINRRIGKGEPEKVRIEDDEAERLAAIAIEQAQPLRGIPISIIDEIKDRIEAAGLELHAAGELNKPWKVGEVAGRSLGVRNGQVAKIVQPDRNLTVNAFQRNETEVIILTEAGSTGISLNQTSPDEPNRHMLELQRTKRAQRRIQFFGRIWRRGIFSIPGYTTLSTALASAQRDLAIQNRKISTQSAIVAGNEDSHISLDIPDPYNSLGNRIARQTLEEHRDLTRIMKISLQVDDNEAGSELYYVEKLMGRLPFLLTVERDFLFNKFIENYSEALIDLSRKGRHPTKPRDLEGVWEIEDRQILVPENSEDGPIFGAPVYLTKVSREVETYPIDELDLDDLVKKNRRTLLELYGSEEPSKAFGRIRKHIIDTRPAVLQSLLPQKYRSVAEALSAKENNRVKLEAERQKSITAMFDAVQIGSEITITDEAEGILKAIVTGVRVPNHPDDYAKPGQYALEYVLPGDERPRRSSLATLTADRGFQIYAPNINPNGKMVFPRFRGIRKGLTREERLIIDGNPVMAVKTALERDLGTTANIRLADGTVHAAVLIPKSKQHHVKSFPYVTSTIESANNIIANGGVIYTDSRLPTDGMRIERDGPSYKVTIPGKASLAKQFETDLFTDICGEFTGDWRGKIAFIPVSRFPDLAKAMKRSGLMFNYDHNFREFALDAGNAPLAAPAP